jgi:hypothetical protein
LAYSSTLKMEVTCSAKMSVDFSRLHGIMPQKLELFMLKLDLQQPICAYFVN